MHRSAFTLLELLVVLAVLVALAALAVPMMGNRVASSQLDSTYQTMLAIREAIMGSPGYFPDVKGLTSPNFTRTTPTANSAIADPAGLPSEINDLFVNPGISINGNAFDPLSRKGWRGPYLSQTLGSLSTDPATGKMMIRDSFPAGTITGNPILIEWPTSATAGTPGSGGIPTGGTFAQYVRLRSFGTNGQRFTALDTIWDTTFLSNASATNAGPATWGDDLILYIRRDVPGIDWTNYFDLRKAQGY